MSPIFDPIDWSEASIALVLLKKTTTKAMYRIQTFWINEPIAFYIFSVWHFLGIIWFRKRAPICNWKINRLHLNWTSENDVIEQRLIHIYWIIHNIANIEINCTNIDIQWISSFIFITHRNIKFTCTWRWKLQHNRQSIKNLLPIFNTQHTTFDSIFTLHTLLLIQHTNIGFLKRRNFTRF